MQSTAKTMEDYLKEIPEERKLAFLKLRESIVLNLPNGFVEVMNYGMLGYVVPHSLYPKGYHCDPKLPLPFINLALLIFSTLIDMCKICAIILFVF